MSGWSRARLALASLGRRGDGARRAPSIDPRSVVLAPEPPTTILGRCGRCGGALRYPSRRERRAGRGMWRVLVRCPECDERVEEILATEALAHLDRADEEAEGDLAAALMVMERVRLGDDMEFLIACLRDDHILPEDF